MLPTLESNKELYLLLDETYELINKRSSAVFFESLIKKEVVTKPTNKLDISVDEVKWFTLTLCEFCCFFSYQYKALIKKYLSSHYTVSSMRLANKYDTLSKYIEELDNETKQELKTRESFYNSLWSGGKTLQESKEAVAEAFSAFCYYIFKNDFVAVREELEDDKYIDKSHDFYKLVYFLAESFLTISDKAINSALVQDWKRKHRCSYCGGELKGLFSKKCLLCGKKKDY